MKRFFQTHFPDPSKLALSVTVLLWCFFLCAVFLTNTTGTNQKQTITTTSTGESTVQTVTLSAGNETPYYVADTDTITIIRQQKGYSTLTYVTDKTAGTTSTLTTTPTKYLDKGEPVTVGTKINRTNTLEITSKPDGTIIIVDIIGGTTYTLEKSYKKETSIHIPSIFERMGL